MPRRALVVAHLLAAVVLAGCGGDDNRAPASGAGAPPSGASTLTTAGAAKLPALARTALRSGELLFTGQASPATHGTFELDGRYVVRFEQFAPENPKQDFSDQTPFTAALRPAGSSAEGAELFGAARASGRREVTRHGRYALDVTFGDFPYAVRFTPRR